MSASGLSRSDKRTISGYCDTGKKLLAKGKKLQALEYFQAALEIDKQCAEAWSGLAAVYRALGKVNKAEEVQRESVSHLIKTVNLNKIKRKIKRLLKKYKRVARFGVFEIGKNAMGIGIYGFTDKAQTQLMQIENEIEALNAYFTNRQVEKNTYYNIKKQCVSLRVKQSIDKKLIKIRRSYKWFIWRNIVKKGSGKFMVSDSPAITKREKELRNQILAVDTKNGNAWCDEAVKKLLKTRKELPSKVLNVLGIVGIVVGCALALVALYFIIKYLIYIIIGGFIILAVIGFFLGDR